MNAEQILITILTKEVDESHIIELINMGFVELNDWDADSLEDLEGQLMILGLLHRINPSYPDNLEEFWETLDA